MCKKGIAICLALLMSLICAGALAQITNLDISTEYSTEAPIQSIQSMTVFEDAVYMYSWEALVRWKPEGDEGLFETLHMTQAEGETEDISPTLNGLFTDGGSLYGLFTQYAAEKQRIVICPITVSGTELMVGEPLPADLMEALMTENGDGDYPRYIHAMAASGGICALLTEGDNREQWESRTVFTANMSTGEVKKQPLPPVGITHITPYKDGTFLVSLFDEMAYYNSDEASRQSMLPSVRVFDPAAGTLSDALITLDMQNNNGYSGLAYDAAQDAIYLSHTDGVYRYAPAAEHVAYLRADYFGNFNAAVLLSGSYYIIYDYDNIYVRSTDPAHKQSIVLRYQANLNWTAREAISVFTKIHPEVALVTVESDTWLTSAEQYYTELTGGNAADIYSVQDPAILNALITKDYCFPLDDPAIMDSFARMYPYIANALQKDGIGYAFPLWIYANDIMGYSPSVIAEMGLTEADIPHTVAELIDFLIDWVDEYSFEYPGLRLARDDYMQRSRLIQMITGMQVQKCLYEGVSVRFGTPEIRALLAKLDDAYTILSELEPTEEEASEGFSWSSDEKPDAVFTLWFDPLSNRNGLDDYTILPLSLDESTPPIFPMSVETLFIPKTAQHPELAMELLALIAAHPESDTNVRLYPDQNEPVENRYYIEDKNRVLERMDRLQKEIETADASDAADLKLMLEEDESYLEMMEQWRYEITPAAIAAYRSIDSQYAVSSPIYSIIQSAENLRTLYFRYNDREVSTDQFLSEIDRVLLMIEREAQ